MTAAHGRAREGDGMRRTFKMLGVLGFSALLSIAVGCSGGGEDATGGVGGNNGGSSLVSAGFSAEQPIPGALSGSLQPGSSTGNTVTVLVQLTDISDVFGVGFDVVYDASRVDFVGRTAGNVLESGGASVEYFATAPSAGRLVVSATRVGASATTVDVSGTETVVGLTFRVKALGSFPISIQNPSVFDGQNPPQEITGVTWHAGNLEGT